MKRALQALEAVFLLLAAVVMVLAVLTFLERRLDGDVPLRPWLEAPTEMEA